MIVLFAGAGASRAVSERYPTTTEFFADLSPDIKNDRLFKAVDGWLLESLGLKSTLDIENVLWALFDLRTFFARISDRKTIEGWMFRLPALLDFLNIDSRFPGFNTIADKSDHMLHLLDNLSGRINERVYRLYRPEPSADDLSSNWLPLLKPLLESGPLEVFTTNYDRVIESAAWHLAGDFPTLPRLDIGRNTAVQERRRVGLELGLSH